VNEKARTAFEILARENLRMLRVYLRSLVRDEAAVNEYTLVHGEASSQFFLPPPRPRLANCLDVLLPEHLEMLFYRSRRRFEYSSDQHSKREFAKYWPI
jgi:hypothetical protein